MFPARDFIRFLALPVAMAAFIMAAQMSGGLVLRTEAGLSAKFANLP